MATLELLFSQPLATYPPAAARSELGSLATDNPGELVPSGKGAVEVVVGFALGSVEVVVFPLALGNPAIKDDQSPSLRTGVPSVLGYPASPQDVPCATRSGPVATPDTEHVGRSSDTSVCKG